MATASYIFSCFDFFTSSLSAKETDYDVGTLPAQLPESLTIIRLTGTGASTTAFPKGRQGRLFFIANDSDSTLTINQFGGAGLPVVLNTLTGAIIYCDDGTTYRPLVSTSGIPLAVSYPLVVDGTGQPAGSTALRIVDTSGGTGTDIKENGDITTGNINTLTYDTALGDLIVGSTIKLHGEPTNKSIDTDPLPADSYPTITPENQQIYQSSIGTGILRNPDQDVIDVAYGITAGFPTQRINSFYGAKQLISMNASNITYGRRGGVNVIPGNSIAATIGNTFSFQDRCVYDGLQIRGRKVGSGFTGVSIPQELDGQMFKVFYFLEGVFATPSGSTDILNVVCNQYRGGAFLRQYKLGVVIRHSGSATIPVCESGFRYINGASTAFSEDIIYSDELTFEVENDPTSGSDFTLTLLKGGVEVFNQY